MQITLASGSLATLLELHNVSVSPSWTDSQLASTQPPTLQQYSNLAVVTLSRVREVWALPMLPASVRTLTLDVSPYADQCVPVPCWTVLFLWEAVLVLLCGHEAYGCLDGMHSTSF